MPVFMYIGISAYKYKYNLLSTFTIVCMYSVVGDLKGKIFMSKSL